MKVICYCYLEIFELVDWGVSSVIRYVDFYELIIKFLERGGSFIIR